MLVLVYIKPQNSRMEKKLVSLLKKEEMFLKGDK